MSDFALVARVACFDAAPDRYALHPIAMCPMSLSHRGLVRLSVRAAFIVGLAAVPLQAQGLTRPGASLTPTQRAVLAVVDSAMTFIQSGEMIRLSDVMTPEAQIYATSARDGAPTYRMRTAPQQRATGSRAPIIERGYDAEVRVAGTMAVVWMPYDLYVDRKWSHCGVDVFTLMQDGSAWRIVNLSYTVEQPPACAVHPSGAAPGTSGTPGGR